MKSVYAPASWVTHRRGRRCCWRWNGCQYRSTGGAELHPRPRWPSLWHAQEAAKALDKRHLCVLAPNCDEPLYVKLVEALCAEHQINLIRLMTTGDQATVEASLKQIRRRSYVKCWLSLRNG
ncbi:40S ribosomal protein S12 [Lemmus lemmus]